MWTGLRPEFCIFNFLFLTVRHCHYAHSAEYLCQFDTTAIDARFHCPFGYLQKINYLLITQLLYVAQDYACTKVRREFINPRLHLFAKLSAFHLSLHGVSGGAQMVGVIFKVIGVRVLRRALAAA